MTAAEVVVPPAPATPEVRRRLFNRNRMACAQLRAYVRILLDNLDQAEEMTPTLDTIRQNILAALQEFEAGTRDKLSVFFEIKALEYRAARLLHLSGKQYQLFLRTDLRQTPASEAQVSEVIDCFFDKADADQPVADNKAKRVTLIALAYWQQYADGLLKASRRERYIAIILFGCLALYLSPLLLLGGRELLHGTFFTWFQSTSDKVVYLGLGCAGAIVSMSLSNRNLAVMANRPLDDLYMLSSMLPRIGIGALAGSMATYLIFIIKPILNLPGLADDQQVLQQVLQMFLAFSGGFADRLFLQKLVDATWKMSGLTPAEK